MMLDQVKNLSHQMRLFGIHQACDRRAAEALAQQLHPLEFLRLVLEEELLARKDRTAKALKITVTPFSTLPRGAKAGLETEAEDVGRFLGTPATLTVA